MNTNRSVSAVLTRITDAVQSVEPSAFLVLPRVLRRVIRQDCELPALSIQVPHLRSHVILGSRLRAFVANDELGLADMDDLPQRVILLPRPTEEEILKYDLPVLLRDMWRLLFHARIHVACEQLQDRGELAIADIQQRIDQIGQVAFDEIQSVLRRERFLSYGDDLTKAFIEFIAVFSEFSYFAPHWISVYFPALDKQHAIDELVKCDIDSQEILEDCRVAGALEPAAERAPIELQSNVDEPHGTAIRPVRTLTSRRFLRLLARAERLRMKGNSVGAALLFARCARESGDQDRSQAEFGVATAVDHLVERLQQALDFEDEAAVGWRDCIQAMLAYASRGFWNSDRKLLYDLQKVCVDHERGVYRVDLLEWVRTFGKRKLKRHLPNQREVLMSKHLRSASRRLITARLTGVQRDQLASLIAVAAKSAENQLRHRLQPLVREALSSVGLVADNHVEQIGWNKLVDELIDDVVHRGFLTMGALRDAISRSNIKLSDLSGVAELWHGDRLLQADRQLDVILDGVYHRGEFYMRWMQGMSSIAFGTRLGRVVTKLIIIPFGGAYLIIEAVIHVAGLFTAPAESSGGLPPWFAISELTLGFGLMGLIHVSALRSLVADLTLLLWRTSRQLLIDLPHWMLQLSVVRQVLRSVFVQLAQRYVVRPALMALVVCALLPLMIGRPIANIWWTLGVFLVFNLIFNSRLGRDCEEVAAEWVGQLWHRIRVGVFVALFEVVMDFFKWMLESFERFLYAVDEWLRFKSGETRIALVIKSCLGVVWSVLAYGARFCLNLLVEPQINPIKHFPVVTVSHKIILPLGLPNAMLSQFLQPVLERADVANPVDVANAIAGTTVFLIPGIFGFLVWELKSNWRLYEANRPGVLKPVIVGDHGETVARLVKPGIHSGTLPKLYAKLRRAERKELVDVKSKCNARLQHMQIEIRQFAEREFIAFLEHSPAWRDNPVFVGRIDLMCNSIHIELCCPSLADESAVIALQDQSGWLVACTAESGWLLNLPLPQRDDLLATLAGFYKISGVDLVREQLEACFSEGLPPYDVNANGLTVWPSRDFRAEVQYNLNRWPTITPFPQSTARKYGLPELESDRMIFAKTDITWNHWVSLWQARHADVQHSVPFSFPTRLLPHQ